MKDTANLNLITTESGQQYVIDHLDQVALGVLSNEGTNSNPAFIPTTYSVYKTVTENEYLLEITQYDNEEDVLRTSYKVISGTEVLPYLDNGSLNVLMH